MAEVAISFAESAVCDLEAIRDWYADALVPQVGERLISEIFTHVEVLQHHPDVGRIVPEFGSTHLRELIHPPFRIVYKREHDKVRIVRIWRSERLLKLAEGDKA